MPGPPRKRIDAPIQPNEAFGRVVQAIRNRLSWTQSDLADRAGLSQSFISGIERGARNPTLDTIWGIAQGLGVLPSRLFDEVDALLESASMATQAPRLQHEYYAPSEQPADIASLTHQAPTAAEAFGRAVQSFRSDQGLTLDELEWKCDASRRYLGSIELGKHSPTIQMIYVIAIGLDVPAGRLLRRAEDVLRGGNRTGEAGSGV